MIRIGGPPSLRSSAAQAAAILSAAASIVSAPDWGISSGDDCPQPAAKARARTTRGRARLIDVPRLLPVLETFGQRVGETRGADRGLSARDVVLRSPVGHRCLLGV